MEHDDSYATGVLTECTIQVCGWIYCICMTSRSRLLLQKIAKSLNSIDFPCFGWLKLIEIHHFDFGSPCLGSGSFRRIFPISLGLRWEKSKSRYHDVGGLRKFVKRCKQTISIHQLMVGWFDALFASLNTWDLLDIAIFLAKVSKRTKVESFYSMVDVPPIFRTKICGVRNTTSFSFHESCSVWHRFVVSALKPCLLIHR